MIIGVLIMSVLVVAAGILLFTAPQPEVYIPDPVDESPTSSIGLPNEIDNVVIPGNNPATPQPTDDDDDDDDDDEPPQIQAEITSIAITYANTSTNDFSEPVGARIPLRARIEPVGIEHGEEIEWLSSNPSVFEVVKDNLIGDAVTVTMLSRGTATLTLRVGNFVAECTVRVT